MARAAILAGVAVAGSAASDAPVAPVPAAVRAGFHLSPFYQKYVDVDGVPILSSAKVSDYALIEARYIITEMIGSRPDVLAAIARNHVRLAVMAPTEMTTDVPEHSDLTPKDYWDKRARGLGATEARPAVSCAEENLLGYPGDPYPAENILIHEFGHVVHERGMNSIDGTFDHRLHEAYEAATRAGLWRGTYAGSNYREYWAVGTQCWFDCSRTNDVDHNAVGTRADIKKYDPRLAALLSSVYGDGEWRYIRPAKRIPPSAHLAGFDVSKARAFAWPARLLTPTEREAQSAAADIPAGGGMLPALAPSSRASWKSAGGGQGTKVIFQNSSGGLVQVDWMDYQGQPKTYFTLQPGQKIETATYPGHIWRARDARGTVLAYFTAGVQPGTAVIGKK
ncbi:MAG TPA: hypothetical protein VHD32_12890 [Candidatus Didemnitutus sp.]|nr:hypothetical protein [Candidatus Didemnitutus sp.]